MPGFAMNRAVADNAAEPYSLVNIYERLKNPFKFLYEDEQKMFAQVVQVNQQLLEVAKEAVRMRKRIALVFECAYEEKLLKRLIKLKGLPSAEVFVGRKLDQEL